MLVAFRIPVGVSGEPIRTEPERVADWSLAALDTARSLDAPVTAEALREAVEDWSPEPKQPYIQAMFPLSLTVVLPLLASLLGYRAVRRRASARLVNRAMYATLFGALLTFELLIFFLPGVVAMAVASFQVRKYEYATRLTDEPEGGDDPEGGDEPEPDDVIDVDEVEVDAADADEVADDEVADEERAP